MHCSRDRFAGCCFALIATLSIGDAQVAEAQESLNAKQNVHALLVGCSDYVNEDIPDLRGPENDVRLFREVLVGKFQFPDDDRVITTLSGANATCAKITAAFENVARTVTPGSQVVILLSGHGAQPPEW